MTTQFLLISVLCILGLTGAPAQVQPAWNPDSADLLFASGRDGNSEIYLRRAGQKDWINLSNHEAGDNWPVWSPDGTQIAFQSKRAGNLDIWKMKADGSEQRQLTTDSEPDYLPSWSPDGKSILFTSWRRRDGEERAPHIYAMDTDGSNQRRLVAESLNTSAGATWSPDGRQIVYSKKGDKKGADVFIADADGGNERRITNDQDRNLYNGSPMFSPDGKWIAFYADDEKTSALVVMAVDGTNRRTVLAEGKNWYPRWSPDGRWLVYTAAVTGADEGNIDILAVPASGDGKPMLLAGSPKREQEGSWRPR